MGGDGGKTLRIEAGDLLVLPAGVGHKRVSASESLIIMGAYPDGQQEYDICCGQGEQPATMEAVIADVALPESDPFYGKNGPLLQSWRQSMSLNKAN